MKLSEETVPQQLDHVLATSCRSHFREADNTDLALWRLSQHMQPPRCRLAFHRQKKNIDAYSTNEAVSQINEAYSRTV